MFGSNKHAEELARRLDRAEKRLARLEAATDREVPPPDDAAVGVRVAAGRGSRFRPRFNKVYRADGFGYVSVYFAGGRTGTVRILVGEEEPPDYCVGEANTGGDINSYAGAVVRPGEFWTLSSNRDDGGGYKAVFTPLC